VQKPQNGVIYEGQKIRRLASDVIINWLLLFTTINISHSQVWCLM